jgi:hypothetical protein
VDKLGAHISFEDWEKAVDTQIQEMENMKQWYLDYRMGSGMTPMLEEFAGVMDHDIARMKLMKQFAKQIEPKSLLGKSR